MVSIINNFYNHLHIQMKAQICKYKHIHSMSALWGTGLGVEDSTVNKTDKVPAVIELLKKLVLHEFYYFHLIFPFNKDLHIFGGQFLLMPLQGCAIICGYCIEWRREDRYRTCYGLLPVFAPVILKFLLEMYYSLVIKSRKCQIYKVKVKTLYSVLCFSFNLIPWKQ